jgi:hypothetical protein
MKRIIVSIVALPLLAFSSLASALTCEEVSLSSAITDRYADAADACVDVVERDGETFVKMKVELTRAGRASNLTFRFMHADGTSGPTHSISPPSGWRARIDGRSYRARDLARGQELSVYLPPDRWEAHVTAPDMELEMISLLVITRAEPEPAMLPATASNMPLFALFGGLALFGAGLIRVMRSRAS